MTRRTPLLAAVAALLVLATSGAAHALFDDTLVPSGKVASESRNVGSFSGVSVAIPGTVVVRQGEPVSVSIDADDNLLPQIETVVERGKLRIRFRRGVDVMGRATIRLLVVTPTIESLSVAGSGDLLSEALTSDALSVSVAGSGDVKIARLEVRSLKVSVAGSGDVKLAGRAAEVGVSIAGSGDVQAGRLESRQARVSIAGAGDATLWVAESLKVSAVGSGDVRYYGDASVSKSVVGSGSVERLGSAP